MEDFTASVHALALRLADRSRFESLLAAKSARLQRDEQIKSWPTTATTG